MHQSIPAVPIPPITPPPPPPPRATAGHFLMLPVSEGGAFAYLGLSPGHLTRGVSRVFAMEAFIGQDVDYVADYLVHEGLEKLVTDVRGCF